MPKRKSEIEERADEVISDLEEMCLVKCSPEDYKAALERIQEHIEASIDAVKDDIRRKNREG